MRKLSKLCGGLSERNTSYYCDCKNKSGCYKTDVKEVAIFLDGFCGVEGSPRGPFFLTYMKCPRTSHAFEYDGYKILGRGGGKYVR